MAVLEGETLTHFAILNVNLGDQSLLCSEENWSHLWGSLLVAQCKIAGWLLLLKLANQSCLLATYNMDVLVITLQALVLLWWERAGQLHLLARCLRQLQLQCWGSLGVVRSEGGKRCRRYKMISPEQSLYLSWWP